MYRRAPQKASPKSRHEKRQDWCGDRLRVPHHTRHSRADSLTALPGNCPETKARRTRRVNHRAVNPHHQPMDIYLPPPNTSFITVIVTFAMQVKTQEDMDAKFKREHEYVTS